MDGRAAACSLCFGVSLFRRLYRMQHMARSAIQLMIALGAVVLLYVVLGTLGFVVEDIVRAHSAGIIQTLTPAGTLLAAAAFNCGLYFEPSTCLPSGGGRTPSTV